MRKKIIIAEIENWRKNHLLPEHYCIFLLNLYSSGEHRINPVPPRKNEGKQTAESHAVETGGVKTDGTRRSPGTDYARMPFDAVAGSSGAAGPVFYGNGRPPQAISWQMMLSWLLGASVIAAIILLAFHFNGFGPLMQIAIFAGFALFFYMLAVWFRKKNSGLTHLFLALSFLVSTAGGIYMLRKLEMGEGALLFYVTVLCLLWCGNGLVFRFSYYLYCGLLGLGLIYGFATIGRVSASYSWWLAELYWVPLSLLMIGLGFLLHERNRQLAGALAICGMVLFFGAEIQSLYIARAKHDVIQLLLFVKVFLSSAFFFLTRRQWFAWLKL
nr:hypothetical protein [Brevibacillus sp. SYP-B805]